MRRNWVSYLVVCALIIVFLWAGVSLLNFQLEIGDALPAFSTYRADPEGLRILFESLQRLPVGPVQRQKEPMSYLQPAPGKILVFAGIDATETWLSGRDFQTLIRWAENGGTVVLSFALASYESVAPGELPVISSNSQDKQVTSPQGDQLRNWTEVLQVLGVHLAKFKTDTPKIVQSNVLPPSPGWTGPLYFTRLSHDWTTVASASLYPVVAQRKFGSGKVVLLASTYPLTNRAMAERRDSALLAYLFGDAHGVVFDETHLSVVNDPEIITLLRRYGLFPSLFAVILIALLYIWRSRYSLLPRQRTTSANESIVPGKAGDEIFRQLLRRSVPSGQALGVCAGLWRKSFPNDTRLSDDLLTAGRASNSLVTGYNLIAQKINERTSGSTTRSA
jgi:hypothetical protein